MAETSKAVKKDPAVVEAPAVKKDAGPRGAWVVLGPEGRPRMVEASKMRALEAAVEVKGSIELWEFGVWQPEAAATT